jgi:putative glutamine amidotransferase
MEEILEGCFVKRVGLVVFAEDQKVENYVRWIEEAGFSVVILSREGWERGLKEVSGIVLPGGGDLDPALYNAPPICAEDVNRERDEFEMEVFTRTWNTDLPVLGICRGMQVINVARGGTLIQDIVELMGSMISHRGEKREDGSHETVFHYIDAVEGTIIEELAGKESVEVNSSHHQAVEMVGEGLKEAAFCISDGVVEAVQGTSDGGGLVLGVQWHPERMESEHPLSGGLLKRLFE